MYLLLSRLLRHMVPLLLYLFHGIRFWGVLLSAHNWQLCLHPSGVYGTAGFCEKSIRHTGMCWAKKYQKVPWVCHWFLDIYPINTIVIWTWYSFYILCYINFKLYQKFGLRLYLLGEEPLSYLQQRPLGHTHLSQVFASSSILPIVHNCPAQIKMITIVKSDKIW